MEVRGGSGAEGGGGSAKSRKEQYALASTKKYVREFKILYPHAEDEGTMNKLLEYVNEKLRRLTPPEEVSYENSEHICCEDTGNWYLFYAVEQDQWFVKNDFIDIVFGPVSYCPYCGEYLNVSSDSQR